MIADDGGDDSTAPINHDGVIALAMALDRAEHAEAPACLLGWLGPLVNLRRIVR
jgi:hypothetical protein